MNKQKVIIVHGAYGNPGENWFPWLAEQVKGYGQEAQVPSFPTPDGQSLDKWRVAFRDQVGSVDEGTVLVGHSIGAAFVLRVVEEAARPVSGTFLVSGFIGELGNPQFDPLNSSFFAKSFDWRHIRQNAGVTRVYNGDNDPYVPLAKGRELAQHLGVDLTVIKGGGHINASAGFLKFEELLTDLVNIFHWKAKSP